MISAVSGEQGKEVKERLLTSSILKNNKNYFNLKTQNAPATEPAVCSCHIKVGTLKKYRNQKKKKQKRCFGVQLCVLGPIPAVISSPFAGAKAQSPSGLPESPGFGPILHFPLGVSRSRAGRAGEGAEPSGQGRGERTANMAPLAVWFPSIIYSSLLKGEGGTPCSELPERLLAGHSEQRQHPQEGMHLRPVLPQK